MCANRYRELLAIKKGLVLEFQRDSAGCALCPDMGGRVFAEVCGHSMHRIDLECVARPNRPFNNFGGGTFWPAPEGGMFAFNYQGNEWCVQECINKQPFEVVSRTEDGALLQKRITLVNRAGTVVETTMKRELKLFRALPPFFKGSLLRGSLTYQTVDSFEVLNPVIPKQALIAAWTLEQFEPSESTISFCPVENPRIAINFDFYDPPGDRISYFKHGFIYKTDGQRKGQIGIKKQAGAPFIAFYDVSRNLVCTRENRSVGDAHYFNMADNDQPNGPFSASDNYSIFNSDPDMQAFELELVSGARIQNGLLRGSELVSVTTFAVFKDPGEIRNFFDHYIT
jgi:hypothetical protein